MSERQKNGRSPQKRCRHVYGEERQDGFADEHQVCIKCGAVRFKGDRYAYNVLLKSRLRKGAS